MCARAMLVDPLPPPPPHPSLTLSQTHTPHIHIYIPGVPGAFLLLVIDPARLEGGVKYEPAVRFFLGGWMI